MLYARNVKQPNRQNGEIVKHFMNDLKVQV